MKIFLEDLIIPFRARGFWSPAFTRFKGQNLATPPSLIVVIVLSGLAGHIHVQLLLIIHILLRRDVKDKGKCQILPFEFKTVPRSTKREKNARKTSCRHVSLTSKRYVCCNTSTYPSNSQVLYTLGGGAENRHVIKLNSEFLRFDVFNLNEESKTSARHAASKPTIKQFACCNHNNEGNASSYTSSSQTL